MNKLFSTGKKHDLNEEECIDSANLDPEHFQDLISLLPSKMAFTLKYMLCVTCNNPRILLLYGITPIIKRHTILRMAQSLKEGYTIRENLQATSTSIEKFKRDLKIKCEKSKIFMNKNIIKVSQERSLKFVDEITYKNVISKNYIF